MVAALGQLVCRNRTRINNVKCRSCCTFRADAVHHARRAHGQQIGSYRSFDKDGMLVLALPPRPLDRDAKAEFGIPVRLEACMSHSNSGNSGTCATFEPPVLRFCPGFPLLIWLSSHIFGGLPTNEARFPKPEKSSFEQQQANLNDQTKITAERSRKNRTFFRYCTISSPPPWLTLKRMRRTNRHRSSRWYVANPRGPVPRHRPWPED